MENPKALRHHTAWRKGGASAASSVDASSVLPDMEPESTYNSPVSRPSSTLSSGSSYQDSALLHMDSSEDGTDSYNNYYGYGPTADDFPPAPPLIDSSMTPERRARKQRVRPCNRRGGACHSDLMKSAVLATLESYESGDEDFNNSRASMGLGSELTMDDNSRSSRKRARQNFNVNDDESSVDDCLLGAMDFCSISTKIPAQPVRHVARRTSRELAYARRKAEDI